MAAATKTRRARVNTEEITVGDLQIGSLIKHRGVWTPVIKIVADDEILQDEVAIYTKSGLHSRAFIFETIDVAVEG